MKRILLLLSLRLVKIALRLYGWRTGPKPNGFPVTGERRYWRPMPGKPNHIDAATFAEAINSCIKEERSK
jgi:hypothetical protein